MAKINSTGTDLNINADGFDQAAGSTSKRKLAVTGADITLTGSGSAVFTFPAASDTLGGLGTAQTWTAVQTLTAPVVNTSLTTDYLTASEIVISDGSKKIISAAVATYPSLTELAYVKGVTSAIQTQVDSKEGTLTNSAGLLAALNDETGTSLAVFNTSPTLVTPLLGTPTSGVLTNCTGLPEAGLADNAVTLAKMAGGTDGNLITYDASGDPAYVVTGTSAQVLTSNGAGAAPTFQAAGGGGGKAIITIGVCSLPASTTAYIAPVGTALGTSGSANGVEFVVPFAGTLKNFYMFMYETLNGTGGQTIVWEVWKNNASTGITFTQTVADTTQMYSDTSNTASVVAGDKICLKFITGSITANTGRISGGGLELTPS